MKRYFLLHSLHNACVEEHWMGPRLLLHTLRHYTLRHYTLADSTPTVKLPNLIPRQIFRLYGR